MRSDIIISIASLCKICISKASRLDVFISPKSNKTFFYATLTYKAHVISFSRSDEHKTINIQIDHIVQPIDSKVFNQLENLLIDKAEQLLNENSVESETVNMMEKMEASGSSEKQEIALHSGTSDEDYINDFLKEVK